jgi:hypothetical protein
MSKHAKVKQKLQMFLSNLMLESFDKFKSSLIVFIIQAFFFDGPVVAQLLSMTIVYNNNIVLSY